MTGFDSQRMLVPYVKVPEGCNLEDYSSKMDELPAVQLLANNWPRYQTESSAVFKIVHNGSSILIKYYIRNDYFQSVQRPINSAVNKDNCVEFFVRFASGQSYYNIEFNCLGVGKVGYGTSRKDRLLLPESYVKQIGVWTRLGPAAVDFDWEILLSIPIPVFRFDELTCLNGRRCAGNFYVCGDELPNPPYLTWSPVTSAEPDFHRPECFGDIVFCEASDCKETS